MAAHTSNVKKSPTSKLYTTWAHILSGRNVFAPQGGGGTAGSKAPGAFLVEIFLLFEIRTVRRFIATELELIDSPIMLCEPCPTTTGSRRREEEESSSVKEGKNSLREFRVTGLVMLRITVKFKAR